MVLEIGLVMSSELGLGLAAMVTTLAYHCFNNQNKPSALISCKVNITKVDWFYAGIYMLKE